MSHPNVEQIVSWAERQTGPRPQGRAGHLTPEEKHEIRLAYFESGGHETYVALGKRFNVNRDTVSACLKGPEFDQLRRAVESEAKDAAVQRLKAAVVPASDAWVRALDIAADKGDHRAAKDLLMHTGTIEPLDDGRASGVLVLMGRNPTEEEARRHSTIIQIGISPADIQVGCVLQPQAPAPSLPDIDVPSVNET